MKGHPAPSPNRAMACGCLTFEDAGKERAAYSLAPRSGERVPSECEAGEGLCVGAMPLTRLTAPRFATLSPQAGRGKEGERSAHDQARMPGLARCASKIRQFSAKP